MSAPKHAHDTSNGRYYTHPHTGQLLVSVTNVLSTAVAKQALVPWAAKITAEKAQAMTPALVASLRVKECRPRRVAEECGSCTPCVVKTIKRAHVEARDRAADLGSRVHDHADAHVTGRQVPHDEEVAPYVAQYLRFLHDFGVDLATDVEAAELTVAHPKLGLAGTLDLLVNLGLDGVFDGKVKALPSGQKNLWLIDIKTSATRPADSLYDENPLQLTALKNCTEMWLPDDTVEPMLRGIVGCAVLNLRTDSYALIPVETGPSEWEAYKGLLEGAKWLHRGVTKDARPIRPNGRRVAKPARRTSTTRKAA